MGPFNRRRESKNQSDKGGDANSAVVMASSSQSEILNDYRNYAIDRPTRSSRNTNPLYKVASCEIGGVKTKQVKERGRAQLTYQRKLEIYRFLSKVIDNPIRYSAVGSSELLGRETVDMKVLKEELLAELQSRRRRGCLMIKSSDIDRWLNDPSFTTLMKNVKKKGQVSTDRLYYTKDPAAIGTSSKSDEPILARESKLSSSTIPMPVTPNGAVLIDTSVESPAPPQVPSSSNSNFNDEIYKSDLPIFNTGEIIDMMELNNETETEQQLSRPLNPPKAPALPLLSNDLNGHTSSSDSFIDVVDVGTEKERELPVPESENPVSSQHAENLGSSMTNTFGAQKVPELIIQEPWHFQAYPRPIQPKIFGFFQRVRDHVYNIAYLYQAMIQQGEYHASFPVFQNLINTWISVLDNPLNFPALPTPTFQQYRRQPPN